MSIQSQVSTSLRQPATYHSFNVKQAAGLVPVAQAIALIGVKSAAGTAVVGTVYEVQDAASSDALFGVGSELALMCRQAIAAGKLAGSSPKMYAICPATPTGSATAETLTVTAASAKAGNLTVTIAGRAIVVGVSAGDTASTIATALKTKIDELSDDLPITAAVATNVVTCTHRTAGVNGNDVAYAVVDAPSGVTVALAQSVAGSGSNDLTTTFDVLATLDVNGIAIANHVANDVADAIAHSDEMWGYATKKFRHVFIADRGTIGTAAATKAAADTSYRLVYLTLEGAPSMPGEIASKVAATVYATVRPNANFDGVEIDLPPPADSVVYTNAEVESALAAGMTPLTRAGARLKIERLVTTKISENSAPFYGLADLAFSRTEAAVATQVDAQYRLRFRQEVLPGPNDPDAIEPRVRDMVIEIHRAFEDQGVLRDVDDLVDQIRVERSSVVSGRILVQDPFRVAGPLHQADFQHVMELGNG